MSPPVTYLPAYVGLFASLVLAMACNIFLDIQYGGFGVEVTVWAVVFGITLRTAWKQHGRVDERGLFWQKVWVIIAALISVLLFLPMWGLPRAGLYALAALQAAANCVTVSRRKFMLALMASAVMVMFATTHYRADWTMMFYLVPYLFAVVFTLVAEQVSRRAQEVQQSGLGHHIGRGQGASIVAATTTLLAVALLLFAVTPQVTWLSLKWKYGQLSNIGILKAKERGAAGGTLETGGAGGGQDASDKSAGADGREGPGDQDIANGQASGPSGDGYRESIGRTPALPTVQEMRQAAKRHGMPAWQSVAIETLAGTVERLEAVFKPIQMNLGATLKQAADWLQSNAQRAVLLLGLLILGSLLGAAYMLAREVRAILWLRMQFDYLRFGVLGLHAPGPVGARQLFSAVERLFALNEVEREARLNTHEYLARLHALHIPLRRETSEMIGLFEKARYGGTGLGDEEVARMRWLYRRIYARV